MPLVLGILLGVGAYFLAKEWAEKAEEKRANQNQLPPTPIVVYPSDWASRSVGWPQLRPQRARTSGRAAYALAKTRTGSCCGGCQQGLGCSGCG